MNLLQQTNLISFKIQKYHRCYFELIEKSLWFGYNRDLSTAVEMTKNLKLVFLKYISYMVRIQ